MFFCKYKIYHIKKRSNIYKKHKYKLIGVFLFVGVSLFIVYIENNIESIISNKFSQNKSYNLSIDDVNFSLSGKFALKNFLILDKNNDSIIYSEKISVDPISLSKAIYNEEYNFKNINFIDGFINIKHLLGPSNSNIDLKIDDTLNLPLQNIFVNNIKLKKFKIIDESEVIAYLHNIEIVELEVFDNNFDLDVNDFTFKYKDYSISELNTNISLKNKTLSLNDFNFNLNNSIFKGGINILDPFGKDDLEFLFRIVVRHSEDRLHTASADAVGDPRKDFRKYDVCHAWDDDSDQVRPLARKRRGQRVADIADLLRHLPDLFQLRDRDVGGAAQGAGRRHLADTGCSRHVGQSCSSSDAQTSLLQV